MPANRPKCVWSVILLGTYRIKRDVFISLCLHTKGLNYCEPEGETFAMRAVVTTITDCLLTAMMMNRKVGDVKRSVVGVGEKQVSDGGPLSSSSQAWNHRASSTSSERRVTVTHVVIITLLHHYDVHLQRDTERLHISITTFVTRSLPPRITKSGFGTHCSRQLS